MTYNAMTYNATKAAWPTGAPSNSTIPSLRHLHRKSADALSKIKKNTGVSPRSERITMTFIRASEVWATEPVGNL